MIKQGFFKGVYINEDNTGCRGRIRGEESSAGSLLFYIFILLLSARLLFIFHQVGIDPDDLVPEIRANDS